MPRPKHSYIGVDNKTVHDTLLLLKETDARSRVMFTKLHNMQVEMSGLKASLDKFIAAIVEVHDEPTKLGEVQAVLRDFLNQSQSQNNRKST